MRDLVIVIPLLQRDGRRINLLWSCPVAYIIDCCGDPEQYICIDWSGLGQIPIRLCTLQELDSVPY